MNQIEQDAESGVEIYQLTDGPRPADNIYGEQPYSSRQGNRIAVRYYPAETQDGGLSILDLESGLIHPVIHQSPRFPAFHSWGEHLYYQQDAGPRLLLKRCHYQTLVCEEILALPSGRGHLSYGTVSQDIRYYAVSVHRDDKSCEVLLIDLTNGALRTLAETTDQYFKHEQFSRDGRNRVLIQANSVDVTVVNLGAMAADSDGIDWLPVDAAPLKPIGRWPGKDRYTPRCTGHETWVGTTDRVFLSTKYDEAQGTNVWSARVGDTAPTVVCKTPRKFGHVSVSRCGRYWIGDTGAEDGVPIYIGSFETGTCRRLVFSRTKHDNNQWSHTHPYLTSDNRWLIYTSNRSGIPQVYGGRIPPSLLTAL